METMTKDIYLVGELFRELLHKFTRMENKKNLYKDLTDLTLIEIDTIAVIGAEGKRSMSELANKLGVSFGTPTVTIDRLIGKGYVERIRDEEDRRQVFVRLSQKGEQVCNAILFLKSKVTERVFGILTPAEREGTIKVLSKLNHEFDALFKSLD